MRPTNFLFFSVVLLILSSCNHTSEPTSVPQNVNQLKTIVAPLQEDNDLLPWKQRTFVINSIDDIYETQTEKFIEENPEWLTVDFTTKSIIANRDILVAFNYWQATKVISFSKYVDDNTFEAMGKKGAYRLVMENIYTHYDMAQEIDESQLRLYQIAFVTEKVPSDATIWLEDYVGFNPYY